MDIYRREDILGKFKDVGGRVAENDKIDALTDAVGRYVPPAGWAVLRYELFQEDAQKLLWVDGQGEWVVVSAEYIDPIPSWLQNMSDDLTLYTLNNLFIYVASKRGKNNQ